MSQNTKKKMVKEDIKSWINFVTFDITGDLFFAESFNCLQDSRLHPWLELIFNTLKAIAFLSVINQFWYLRKIQENLLPEYLREKMTKNFNQCAQKADRRLEKWTDRPDFMSCLLKNGLSETANTYRENKKVMSRREIHSNALLSVSSSLHFSSKTH